MSPDLPEQVLSVDALNGVESCAKGEEWVWSGYDLLDEGGGKSLWDRALLFLSPGGTDATVVHISTRSLHPPLHPPLHDSAPSSAPVLCTLLCTHRFALLCALLCTLFCTLRLLTGARV